MHIVGHEEFPFQQLFHHRMPAVLDDDLLPVIELGAYIVPLKGRHGQGIEHIQHPQGPGCFLDFYQMPADILADAVEQVIFQLLDLFFGAEDLVLEILQFRHDVPFPVDQGLLPDEGIRHLGDLSFGHFDVVAEDFVVAHLQVLDAGLVFDLLFEVQHPLVVVFRNVVDFVQLRIEAPADHAPLPDSKGGIIHDSSFQFVQDVLMEADPAVQGMEKPFRNPGKQPLHLGQGPEGGPQSGQVTGIGGPHFDPGKDPLQVGDLSQGISQVRTEPGLVHHAADSLLAEANPGGIQERPFHPLAELPGPHGRPGVIQHFQKGPVSGAVFHVLHQFQVPDGGGVQVHHRISGDLPETVDLGQVALDIFMDVLEHMLHSPMDQGFLARRMILAEMLAEIIQTRHRIIMVQHTVRQFLVHLVQQFSEIFIGFCQYQFCGLQPVQLIQHRFFPVLAPGQVPGAFPSRHIGKGQAEPLAILFQAGQVLIMALFQHRIAEHRPRGQDLGHFPLHDAHGLFRVFHLVADGDLIAFFDQFGQIAVHRMKGHPAHGHGAGSPRLPPCPFGQGQVQFPGSRDGIFIEQLIEISQAEEEQFIFMLFLDFQILLQHRSQCSHKAARPLSSQV